MLRIISHTYPKHRTAVIELITDVYNANAVVKVVTNIDNAACFSVTAINPANVSGYEPFEVIEDAFIGIPSDLTRSEIAQFHNLTNINASSAPIPTRTTTASKFINGKNTNSSSNVYIK